MGGDVKSSVDGKEEKTKLVYRVLLHLHVSLLCLLILIVWVALSLPVVFFNRPPEVRQVGCL